MVVGGRHLDHVASGDMKRSEFAQDRKDLRARGAAGHGRARAGRKGGVEAIDIEGQIGGAIVDMADDGIGDLLGAHLLELVAVDDPKAAILRCMRPDADLDRAFHVDQSLACRAADEGAMIDAAFLVRPGVLMGIELDEGEGPVQDCMGPQDGIGDEVVAAERQQVGAGLQDFRRLALDGLGVLAWLP